ncbi:MAG: hypothetical protein WC260_01065 [Candidatus Pacearchaeota archaeon]
MNNIFLIEEYKHNQLYSSIKNFYDDSSYSMTIKKPVIDAYIIFLKSLPKKKIIKDLISLVEEELVIE